MIGWDKRAMKRVQTLLAIILVPDQNLTAHVVLRKVTMFSNSQM